jgi:hypothetical protein
VNEVSLLIAYFYILSCQIFSYSQVIEFIWKQSFKLKVPLQILKYNGKLKHFFLHLKQDQVSANKFTLKEFWTAFIETVSSCLKWSTLLGDILNFSIIINSVLLCGCLILKFFYTFLLSYLQLISYPPLLNNIASLSHMQCLHTLTFIHPLIPHLKFWIHRHL